MKITAEELLNQLITHALDPYPDASVLVQTLTYVDVRFDLGGARFIITVTPVTEDA